jgi:hypothetical protein
VATRLSLLCKGGRAITSVPLGGPLLLFYWGGPAKNEQMLFQNIPVRRRQTIS